MTNESLQLIIETVKTVSSDNWNLLLNDFIIANAIGCFINIIFIIIGFKLINYLLYIKKSKEILDECYDTSGYELAIGITSIILFALFIDTSIGICSIFGPNYYMLKSLCQIMK